MRRTGRYAATVLVSASVIAMFGYAVRADVPQVPTGTWTAAGLIGEIPRDAASTALADGRLVVIGGSNADSQPDAHLAIFNPATGTWTQAGEMNEARTGHTATALKDGRVLI